MIKILICGFVLVIFYLLIDEVSCEHMENTCAPPATNDQIIAAMGETAKSACQRISTEAENIAARAKGRKNKHSKRVKKKL